MLTVRCERTWSLNLSNAEFEDLCWAVNYYLRRQAGSKAEDSFPGHKERIERLWAMQLTLGQAWAGTYPERGSFFQGWDPAIRGSGAALTEGALRRLIHPDEQAPYDGSPSDIQPTQHQQTGRPLRPDRDDNPPALGRQHA